MSQTISIKMLTYNSLLVYIILCFTLCYAQREPSILVIGAGPSGIAAATRLLSSNFTNVRIFEAENRIGGRIKSVWFGDAYVDLGAEWCHGEKGNIVYDMIRQYNVLRHTNLTFRLIYSDGRYIEDEVAKGLTNFAESIDASVNNEETEADCGNLASIGECFQRRFNRTFLERYSNDSERLHISLDGENWLENYMISFDSPFSLLDLSRRSDYKRCEGDLRLNWNGFGYKTILELMMRQFPDPINQLPIYNNIYLNREVSRIHWRRSNSKILVQSIDNVTEEFDHVIFTPSIGVLKATHEQLFEPRLPEDKVKAIQNFGMGAILKIALHFPETWWNSSELFGFVFSAEDRERITSEFDRGPVKNGRSWLTSSLKFFQAENNPQVLIGFFAGETIPELEKEPDQVIIDGCMYLFKTFLGANYTVLEPDNIIRSSWYSNPHFRGTISYESVQGNSTGNRYPEKLGAPLKDDNGTPSLLFAGEATHPYYFSTVHGAIESGYREADRLINFYAQNT